MYFLLAVLLVVATLMFVTFVPAAPELPGDGAASSSAAAGTEEGANSSAKKDVSIIGQFGVVSAAARRSS